MPKLRLPDEILSLILNHCTAGNKLRQIQFVNKQFRRVVRSSSSWQHVTVVQFEQRSFATYNRDDIENIDDAEKHKTLRLGVGCPEKKKDQWSAADTQQQADCMCQLMSLLTCVQHINSMGRLAEAGWSFVFAHCVSLIPKWAQSQLQSVDLYHTHKVKSFNFSHMPSLFTTLGRVNESRAATQRAPITISIHRFAIERDEENGSLLKQTTFMAQMFATQCAIEDFALCRRRRANQMQTKFEWQLYFDAFKQANLNGYRYIWKKDDSEVFQPEHVDRSLVIQGINQIKPHSLKTLTVDLSDLENTGNREMLSKFLQAVEDPIVSAVSTLDFHAGTDAPFTWKHLQKILLKLPNLRRFGRRVDDNYVTSLKLAELLKMSELFVDRMQELKLSCAIRFPNCEKDMEATMDGLKRRYSTEPNIIIQRRIYSQEVFIRILDTKLEKSCDVNVYEYPYFI